MKFELKNNNIVIPARINGTKTWAVIDTRATYSCTSPQFAKKLKLEIEGGSDGQVAIVMFDEVVLEGVEFPKVQVACVDLSPIEKQIGKKVGMLLGYNIFQYYILTINYPDKELTMELP